MVNLYSALNHSLHNKMKSLTAILLLALLSSSLAQVTILQSSTSTTLTFPAGQSTILSTAFNLSPGPGPVLGAGINWIQSSISGPGTKIFEHKFYASCPGVAILYISAYASFSVTLNGVGVGSGTGVGAAWAKSTSSLSI